MTHDSQSAKRPDPLPARQLPANPGPANPQPENRQGDLDVTADLGTSEELARLLDGYLAELKAGRTPDKRQLLAEHPQLASHLEACLAGLDFIQRTSETSAPGPTLGGFRILREVGRGGMGAVYEAEDLTLGRHVALKVLRFGPLADAEALDRFRRETETVAALHHTNIVPIFSVGSEHGVNYYAMQFIEGRSLAEVGRDGRQPSVRTVASWGLQAAEALQHAHQRGVIHRDVKPSNLLLDADERIWLTDFGLAKRLDDVTLSMTGALLGTPRYMSPEQASAAGGRIDHRTDIYSLGATLYELVTGRPVFTADTPHAVLREILTREPEPARAVRPDVPRDLETILAKCLAKQPAARYATAAELASDLRALLEGRPIKARRVRPWERLVRWGREHRRSLTLTAASVAATLALVFAVTLGRQLQTQWRLAHLSLATSGPPLAAQLFDPRERPATDKQTLPTHEPFAVPAGSYTARLESAGRMSQDVQVQLPAGDQSQYTLDLDDQLLWPSRPIAASYLLVEDPDHSQVLLLDREGIHCQGPQSQPGPAQPGQTLRLVADGQSQFADAPGLIWPWNPGELQPGRGSFDLRPQPANMVDLNGDGVRDYVLAARHQAWVLAISGQDGRPLWLTARGADVRDGQSGNDRVGARPYGNQNITSTVLGPPVVLPDINGDRTADLLVTLADVTPQTGVSPRADVSPVTERQGARRWVEALSGSDGQTLWKHELPAHWFSTDNDDQVPYDRRWFVGSERQAWPVAANHVSLAGTYYRTVSKYPRRAGAFVHVPEPAQLVQFGASGVVCLTAGRQLCLLDPRDGTPLSEPRQLPVRPGNTSQWRDLDADGRPELILVEETTPPPPIAEPQARLVVWSTRQNQPLWEEPLETALPRRPLWSARKPNWPLLVDLNGDGQVEMVVPNRGSCNQPLSRSRLPWGGIEARDARTGRLLWSQEVLLAEQQVSYFVAGPDIDRDGHRELFVAGLWGDQRDVYVQALSGADGRTLWTNYHRPPALSGRGEYWLGSLNWWTAGSDGWPQLLVQLGVDGPNTLDAQLVAFSAGSGQITRTANGFVEFRVTDLDGDRVPELLGFRPRDPSAVDSGGTLDAIRGVPREAWRKMGVPGQSVGDLDGDGLRDLVTTWQDGTMHATAAATGRVLWSAQIRELDGNHPRVTAAEDMSVREAQGPNSATDERRGGMDLGTMDLDGDRVPDLLVSGAALNTSGLRLLHAISGSDGRRLWSTDARLSSIRDIPLLTCRDLDSDGAPEVVAIVAGSWQRPPATNPWDYQLWLTVLSGRSGRLLWKHPLTSGPDTIAAAQFDSAWPGAAFQLRLGDCDRDGTLDLLLPAANPDGAGVELRAIGGNSGQTLWRHPLPRTVDKQPVRSVPPPRLADLDGDGRDEVYLLAFEDQPPEIQPAQQTGQPSQQAGQPAQRTAHVRCLDAGSGKQRWSWETPVPEYCGRIDSTPRKLQARPLPRVVRRRDTEDLLAVAVWDHPAQVILLDHHGRQVARELFQLDTPFIELWVSDVDVDGNDELLVMDQRQLQVRRTDGSGELLWKFPESPTGQLRVVDVRPGSESASATVVGLLGSSRNQLLGIDGATGRERWTCPVPLSRGQGVSIEGCDVRVLDETEPTLLTDGQGRAGDGPGHGADGPVRRGPPYVLFNVGFLTACRQVAMVDVGARPTQPAAVELVRRDARRLRDLPWAGGSLGAWRTAPTFAAWVVFYSLALLLVPACFLVRLVRHRRWSLYILGLLPVVAAFFVMALLLEPPDVALASGAARFGWALAGMPVLLALVLLVRWVRGRKWQLVAAAVGLLPLATLALVTLLISIDQAQWDASTHYRWAGWYWATVPGLYVAACLLSVVWLAVQAGRLSWRLFTHVLGFTGGPGNHEVRA